MRVALSALIAAAVVDIQTRDQLLYGDCDTLLRRYGLTSAERALILAITANTLADFAAHVEEILAALESQAAAENQHPPSL